MGNLLKSTYSSASVLKQEQKNSFSSFKTKGPLGSVSLLNSIEAQGCESAQVWSNKKRINGGEESTMEFHFFSFWWLVNNGVENEWYSSLQSDIKFTTTLFGFNGRWLLTPGPLNSIRRQTSSSEFFFSQLPAFKVSHISPFPNI